MDRRSVDVDETEEDDFRIEEYNSQEELNRVPESPPINTQDEEDYKIEDVPASSSTTHDRKNQRTLENTEGTTSTLRKGSDVVIDIEFDMVEELKPDEDEYARSTGNKQPGDDEFPEEDDALLLSAAREVDSSGKQRAEPVGTADAERRLQEELEADLGLNNETSIDPKVLQEEQERLKIVEGFRKFEAMEKIFPDVRCSEYNTVTFLVKPNYMPMDVLEPSPVKCVVKWDPKFVPMPFSSENVVIIKVRTNNRDPPDGSNEGGGDGNPPGASSVSNQPAIITKKIKVWSRITEALISFSLTSAEDIGHALRRYCARMSRELKALEFCTERLMRREERDNFFCKVVPFMTSLVLQTPDIVTCPLPFLRKNVNHNISLSQRQVACLLANAFFSTFPKRFKSEFDMPSINFKELFIEDDEEIMKRKAQKLRCLIHYFTRIEAEMPQGVVTYTRKNLRHSSMPEWGKLDKTLTKMVPLIQGTIEDEGAGMLKVDFANCFIGGGALGRGAVQEEILFVIYPELILSRLFCEKLNSNEAVIITGCERFSKYHGYASSFTFEGDYQDTTPYDCKGRRCTQIVAIDALYISRPSFQYHPKHITRELNKAYVGFASPVNQPVAVATGKWGCGAFNGDPHLKAVIQLLAASNAGRDVAFFTFGDLNCLNDVTQIYESIKNMKIKDVWHLLCQYHTICCSSGKPTRSLKDFCMQYAAGQVWQAQQEEERQRASTSKRMKEVPITQFYSSEKRNPVPASSCDDKNVSDLINGLDKINSPEKPIVASNLAPGKRQREDESSLTPEQIQKQLLQEDVAKSVLQKTTPQTTKPQNGLKGGNPSEKFSTSPSPNTPKRPKRLVDFYENTNT